MAWSKGEEIFFEDLIQNEELSWDEIREAMIANGFDDRGERAYQSKGYRLSMLDPKVEDEKPEFYDLYRYLRDQPRSLRQLCDKFDLAPKHIRAMLTEMKETGYNVVEAKAGAIIPTKSFPKIEAPDISVADMVGRETFNILAIADNHSGSDKSQPTGMNKVIKYAVEEFGVKHIFHLGDFVSGIYGYKGHDIDLITAARPISRKLAHLATERQVQMADSHIPQIQGVDYHMIGGNHDWWHVVATGLDPLRMLCERRPDIKYMGYDVAKVPLTDKTYMRMWHPTGGVAYAKSYKMQKAIESEGVESLREAIRKEESPHVSIILSGHLHIAAWVPDHPLYGGIVGCFEGQTNYLKRKALSPNIGGVIMRLVFNDDGRVQHVGYDWIHAEEIKDDWKNFPVPEMDELNFDHEDLDTIFELEPKNIAS
jgi:hypothetical protein